MTSRIDKALPVIAGLLRAPAHPTALDFGGGGGKDSIIYARLGFNVMYADFLSPMTELVCRRFQIRNLNVAVKDVRDLDEERFDLINCLDVLEHIYDVEDALAELSSRLSDSGVLMLAPSFYNSWDGDHVEKNCAYRPWFQELAVAAGLELKSQLGNDFFVYVRSRSYEARSRFQEEKDSIKERLYLTSQRLSRDHAIKGLEVYSLSKKMNLESISQVSDNLAVFRLSSHRLDEISRKNNV